jgi:hypothetical protein
MGRTVERWDLFGPTAAGHPSHVAAPARDRVRPAAASGRRRPGTAGRASDADVVVDLTDHGCGNGVWCQACRADIRSEALRWIRELNGADDRAAGPSDLPRAGAGS